jgi:Domain of unknown function DUF29
MSRSDLYDRDFFEWTQWNAEPLRRGCFVEADISHIAGEIADMVAATREKCAAGWRRSSCLGGGVVQSPGGYSPANWNRRFPAECPFAFDQLMDPDFLPEDVA